MTPTQNYYGNLAKTTIKNLEKRHFDCYYCQTSKEATELASKMVPAGSTVSFGGSMTLAECVMGSALRKREDST